MNEILLSIYTLFSVVTILYRTNKAGKNCSELISERGNEII